MKTRLFRPDKSDTSVILLSLAASDPKDVPKSAGNNVDWSNEKDGPLKGVNVVDEFKDDISWGRQWLSEVTECFRSIYHFQNELVYFFIQNGLV